MPIQPPKWKCIFGCDAGDELTHYLCCPILWQFAREFINVAEPCIAIGSRLCLVEPSVDKLLSLAFVHALYHACKNHPGCTDHQGMILPSATVQFEAIGLARSVRHYVITGLIISDRSVEASSGAQRTTPSVQQGSDI